MFVHFKNCLEHYERLFSRIDIQDSGEARIAVCFILTAAEQFGAALALSESGYSSHAPSHIRSLLEGHIELEILAKNPNHYEQLRFESASKDKIFLSQFLASPEAQNDPEAEDINSIRELFNQAEAVLKELAPLNLRTRKTFQAFREAGKPELYLIFRELSSFVHPSLQAIIARHRADEALLYKGPLSNDAVFSHLAIGLTLLSGMMEKLPEFTNITNDDLQPATQAVKQLLQAPT